VRVKKKYQREGADDTKKRVVSGWVFEEKKRRMFMFNA